MEPNVLWPLRGAPGEKLSQGTGLTQTPLKREMDNLQKRDKKMVKTPNTSKNVEKLTHSYIAGEYVKWYVQARIQVDCFLYTKHATAMLLSSHSPGHTRICS